MLRKLYTSVTPSFFSLQYPNSRVRLRSSYIKTLSLQCAFHSSPFSSPYNPNTHVHRANRQNYHMRSWDKCLKKRPCGVHVTSHKWAPNMTPHTEIHLVPLLPCRRADGAKTPWSINRSPKFFLLSFMTAAWRWWLKFSFSLKFLFISLVMMLCADAGKASKAMAML